MVVNRILNIALFIFSVVVCSCSVNKFIGDDEYFLDKVKITTDDKAAVRDYSLDGYVAQTPNTNWFGFKVPLRIYCLAGTDSTSGLTKFFKKIGEEPVIYSREKAKRTVDEMGQMLSNEGYMKSKIKVIEHIKGKKLELEYAVSPNTRYTIRDVRTDIADPMVGDMVCSLDTANSYLKAGEPFNINRLNEERNRITALLRGMGYYKFNRDYISFVADTLSGSTEVDLTLKIALHRENDKSMPELHKQYRIGDINYLADFTGTGRRDSIVYEGRKIVFGEKLHFRPKLLLSNTSMRSGELFSEQHVKNTYANFTRLQGVSYSNVRLQPVGRTDTLDCTIMLNHVRPHSVGWEIEGTNSAGDLGVASSLSYQHKNLFKGSETLTLKLRGAYEAITGLDGYEGQSYTEIGGEIRLNIPLFLLPYVKRDWGAAHNASSEISLQYNRQDRPEFNRRVLTAAWRYRWSNLNRKVSHKFDLLEINYVYMPWISKTFKEQYLDSLGKTNAILRYNYENLLITKLGYTYTYNSLGTTTDTYGKDAYTVRFNVETSGNVLYGITKMVDGKRNEQGQMTFCGTAYAQYVKGDFEISKSVRIDKNNSLALHGAFGIAYPYGNSNVLPFEKRYFSGGANSVRGWGVRSLGPGKYNGADKGINFINQSGDIKLDLNLEYRAFLFWKFNGALFIDAGNIWTIRDYKDQPGGAFRFDEFYKQIAVSYGLGLRLNLDFFVIRFDAGMKAVNPAYDGEKHYPIAHPKLSRDFAFHFAVGLPF